MLPVTQSKNQVRIKVIKIFAITSAFLTSILEMKLNIAGMAQSSVTKTVPFHEEDRFESSTIKISRCSPLFCDVT